MRKLFIIFGFTAAIYAVVIALTKPYNLALTPIIIAFISGLIVIYLSKKQNTATKTIQYVFLLVIIALSLTIYKGIFNSENSKKIAQLEYNDKNQSNVSRERLY